MILPVKNKYKERTTTEIHAVVDALGNSMRFKLTTGKTTIR
ncbi:hypothetical protein [Paenibacillus kribbensis]|nr:hypothetical protein [Paenibacillus kribbensis]